ncbi:MAG: hypothetical protein O3A51_09490 [Verrucomicrobia bacterium]|nr:hypothetical protein [Verrucomicrobiota bacterium]
MKSIVGIVMALWVMGCTPRDKDVEITETRLGRTVEVPEAGLSTAERFGMRSTALPPGHPPIAPGMSMPGTAGPAASPSLTWVAPDGWEQGPDRQMRLVTYTIGEATECYVAELGGMGGGLAANLNRWRGQLGQPPLDASGLDALPQIVVFGEPAPLLDVVGDYVGMGNESRPASRLLGTVATTGGKTYFVKMIGPDEAAQSQKQAFIAFCESLSTRDE